MARLQGVIVETHRNGVVNFLVNHCEANYPVNVVVNYFASLRRVGSVQAGRHPFVRPDACR